MKRRSLTHGCIGEFSLATRSSRASAAVAKTTVPHQESTPAQKADSKTLLTIRNRSSVGGQLGRTLISHWRPDRGSQFSTSTDRRGKMNLKRWLRRTAHPLRHSPARQDAVLTFFITHDLIRLKFGLRQLEKSTSAAKADTSSCPPQTTSRVMNTNG